MYIYIPDAARIFAFNRPSDRFHTSQKDLRSTTPSRLYNFNFTFNIWSSCIARVKLAVSSSEQCTITIDKWDYVWMSKLCKCICLYVCLCICICIRMYVCIYVCMYIRMYVCACKHTWKRKQHFKLWIIVQLGGILCTQLGSQSM